MTYELAKQLKDNGFLQATGGHYYWDRELTEGNSILPFYDERIVTHTIKIPTLSELIEACGDGYNGLIRKGGNVWFAAGGKHLGFYGDEHLSQGSTPEEAVAKLWLALNKK